MEYSRDTVIIRTPGTDVKKNMSESIISSEGDHFPYLLTFSDAGHYLLIGSKEAYIWSCLYRPQTISSLTNMFFQKYQIFGRDFIEELMQKWSQEGFVSVNGVSKFRSDFRFKLQTSSFDKLLKPIYKYFGGPLLSKHRWLAVFTVSIICLIARGLTRPNRIVIDYSHPVDKIIFLLLLALVLGTLHEVAHALVAMKFGVEVKKAGFKFILGIPFFFVDLSETWIRPRKERIAITLAGPLFNVILAGLLCIPVLLNMFPDATQPLREIIWLNLFTVVINLLPFHGLDGYFIMEDITGVPDLNKRAWRAALGKERKNRIALTIYAFFSMFTSVMLLLYTYRTWVGFFGLLHLV